MDPIPSADDKERVGNKPVGLDDEGELIGKIPLKRHRTKRGTHPRT